MSHGFVLLGWHADDRLALGLGVGGSVLRRAGSKKMLYCTLQKLTQTGKTNG